MRRVWLKDLGPGVRLAKPICGSNGQVLITAGTELKPHYVSKLRAMGIGFVYALDGRVPDLVVDDVISDEARFEAVGVIRDLSREVRRDTPVGQCFNATEPRIRESVNRIVEELLTNPGALVNLSDIRAADDYTFAHSVNVCVLAVLTAISLGYKKSRLAVLGLSAMLHDVGKVKVRELILNKPGSLTSEEYEEVKRHTIYGYEILRTQDNLGPLPAVVAHQHHERYNGEGYPQGLRGDQIHEYAKIAAVADVYDALVADRVYRPAFLPNEAAECIAGSGNYYFDHRVAKAFLDNIAIYPVGSTVELSTGHVGVVSSVRKGLAIRPVVQIVQDEHGRELPRPEEIDLVSHPTVMVVKVLAGGGCGAVAATGTGGVAG